MFKVVISIPKLRPANPTAASQETVQLFGEDHREEYPKQQILLPGERQKGRFPLWGRAGGSGEVREECYEEPQARQRLGNGRGQRCFLF